MTRTQKIKLVMKRFMKEFDLENTPSNMLAVLTAMKDEHMYEGADETDPDVVAIDKLIANL